MKTLEEKLAEKKRTLDEINTTLEMSTELYRITTSQYGQLYDENNGKVDGKHIAGIASLLSKITDLFQARNSIENEINALTELDEQQNPEAPSDRIKGSKADILKLMEGGRK